MVATKVALVLLISISCSIVSGKLHVHYERDLPLSVELKQPTYVVANGDEIIIADSGNDRLLAVSTSGTLRRTLKRERPTGVALLNSTTLFVGQQARDSMMRVALTDGAAVAEPRAIADLVMSPLDVLLHDDRIFVSDVCWEKQGEECIGRVVIYRLHKRGAHKLRHERTIDSESLQAAHPGRKLHPHGLAVLGHSALAEESAHAAEELLYVADACVCLLLRPCLPLCLCPSHSLPLWPP